MISKTWGVLVKADMSAFLSNQERGRMQCTNSWFSQRLFKPYSLKIKDEMLEFKNRHEGLIVTRNLSSYWTNENIIKLLYAQDCSPSRVNLNFHLHGDISAFEFCFRERANPDIAGCLEIFLSNPTVNLSREMHTKILFALIQEFFAVGIFMMPDSYHKKISLILQVLEVFRQRLDLPLEFVSPSRYISHNFRKNFLYVFISYASWVLNKFSEEQQAQFFKAFEAFLPKMLSMGMKLYPKRVLYPGLLLAMKTRDTRFLEILLRNGANPMALSTGMFARRFLREKFAPHLLFRAIHSGLSANTLRVLFDSSKASGKKLINAVGIQRNRPLDIAVKSMRSHMIKALLEHGADIQLNEDYLTPASYFMFLVVFFAHFGLTKLGRKRSYSKHSKLQKTKNQWICEHPITNHFNRFHPYLLAQKQFDRKLIDCVAENLKQRCFSCKDIQNVILPAVDHFLHTDESMAEALEILPQPLLNAAQDILIDDDNIDF